MLDDEDLTSFAQSLEDPDPRERAIALHYQSTHPSGDPRVLPLLEKSLQDRTIAVFFRPSTYGELRVLAARALEAERRAQGIEAEVDLGDAPQPLPHDEIGRLAREHGVDYPPGEAGIIVGYRKLRDRGLIPKLS